MFKYNWEKVLLEGGFLITVAIPGVENGVAHWSEELYMSHRALLSVLPQLMGTYSVSIHFHTL